MADGEVRVPFVKRATQQEIERYAVLNRISIGAANKELHRQAIMTAILEIDASPELKEILSEMMRYHG